MKNNKGFTLIEILATISILVIIVSIALPSIISMKDRNIEKNEENIKEIITTAAEVYIYTYNYDIDYESTNNSCIAIEELLRKQLITSNNQIEEIKDKYIQLSKNGNDIVYEITNTCRGTSLVYDESSENDSGNDSGEDIPEESQEYTDGSGANPPDLVEGMIPVKYSNGNWVVADVNEKWYDYNNKEWANAVTTSSSTYRTASPGTTIPISAINSMWVWIPRYKYRITFQTVGVKYSNNFYYSYNRYPGTIDIIFESETKTTGNSYKNSGVKTDSIIERNMSTLAISEYYTHPAFRSGTVSTGKNIYNYDLGGWNKELTGIWVGKFETSGDATTPTIVPNKSPLKSQRTLDQQAAARKFTTTSTYGLNSNSGISHMMKNTEWGAVAYLAQSKYGKVSEIYPNVSTTTGCSSAKNSNDTYKCSGAACNNNIGLIDGDVNTTCNTYNTTVGYNASTTGNIYGIYDMVGGVSERVMSGTAIVTRNEYQEVYSSGDISDIRILGDATFETRGWYFSQYNEDNNTLESGQYFVRGGSRNETWRWDDYRYIGTISAGLFFYTTSNSNADSNIGFRTVISPN